MRCSDEIECSGFVAGGAKASSGAKSSAKGAGTGSTGNTSSDSVVPGMAPHPSDVLDMPVDPNEPTYCLCHQVSYGEMIGCDNPDVSFHSLSMILYNFRYLLFLIFRVFFLKLF